MTDVIRSGVAYEWHACIDCGIAFVLPADLVRMQRQQGGWHYCPNGHCQGWREDGSEFEQLRRERDRLKQNAAMMSDMLKEKQERLDEQTRKLNAQKGVNTKLRRRAAAGVCPCCNRQFANLHSHMKTKHPDFAKAVAE